MSDKIEKQTETSSASAGQPCSVPYETMPLMSEGLIECGGKTTMFLDGRKISVSQALDKSEPHSEGLWIKITKPLDDGEESLLKFRLTEDAAAVLCNMLHDALLPNLEDISGDKNHTPSQP